MENIARAERVMHAVEALDEEYFECEVIEFDRDYRERESLSENFNDEIEAWARHALAANGFGDFL